MNKSCLAVILLVFTWYSSKAQGGDEDILHLEFEFGLGYTHSSSQNYFNDPQGVEPGGAVGINMAFRYHFNYKWSAGIHFLIVADEIADYDSDIVLGYYSEFPLSITNLNLGINGKYTYSLQRWQPYAVGGLGVALGGINSLEYEEQVNTFTGIAINIGMGMGYMLNNYVMVSTSILKNTGVAWWSKNPSTASINNQFNPGFWAISLNVSIFLQEDSY